jgi:EPS-associated MarR family transcriptional regulator
MVFDDGLRCSLFRLLQTDPRISQRALAKALGVSLGKANYCLKAFIDRGWVRPRRFQHNGNKRGYAYIITPDGLEAKERITVRFLQCKLTEYEALQEEIKELRQEIQNYRP